MTKALLIIDIQNDYFDGGTNPLAGSAVACEQACILLNYFRISQMPIIHIQHLATRPDATFFLPNTVGAEIHSNLKPFDNEAIIAKHFPNSFRGTHLLEHLQTLGVTQLVICGMMTHMCIDATTRAAKDLGFEIELISDACATKNLEIQGQIIPAKEVHLSFLAALNYFYASVKTVHEFISHQ